MKVIRDEFNLLPVLWKLEYFDEYLKDVEKLIDSKAIELGNRAAEMVQEIEQEPETTGWHYAALDLFLEEDYEKVENVFPNLLRRSLFIYIYSVFEDALNNCCRLLNFQHRPLEDVKGKDRGIKRARRYLNDAGVKFPDEKWEEITYYQKLRNCIIHNQGRLKGCDHEKDVREFALSNIYLSLTHTDNEGKNIEEMSEFVEIMFHKRFCEEVMETIGDFVEQLRINMEHRQRNEDF